MHTLSEMIALAASACSALTNKMFESRLFEGVSITGQTPNNADGIGRYVMPGTLEITLAGSRRNVHKTQQIVLTWSGAIVEPLAADNVQQEIELLGVSLLTSQPLAADNIACTKIETAAEAPGGYSPEELSNGLFLGALIVTLIDQ